MPSTTSTHFYLALLRSSTIEQMATRKGSLRILLLGKTGCGKSATGNTILGERKFESGVRAMAVSMKSQLERVTWNEKEIEIMDSPGLFDTKRSHKEIASDIVQSMACLHPGPNVVLYVVRLGRYTPEEYETYNRLKIIFDENITRHMIIAFTYGDDLQRDNMSIEEYVEDSSPEFKNVIEECGHRYVVFDNTSKSKDQVDTFITKAEEMIRGNGGAHYTCRIVNSVGKAVEKRLAKRLEKTEQDLLESSETGRKLKQEAIKLKETIERQEKEKEKKELKYSKKIEKLQKQLKQQSGNADDLKKEISELKSEMKAQNEKLKRLEEQKENTEQKCLEETLWHLKKNIASLKEKSWLSEVAETVYPGEKEAICDFLKNRLNLSN